MGPFHADGRSIGAGPVIETASQSASSTTESDRTAESDHSLHMTRLRRSQGPLCFKQGVDEFVGVEWDEVVLSLAEADELYGNAELVLHGNDDAALG